MKNILLLYGATLIAVNLALIVNHFRLNALEKLARNLIQSLKLVKICEDIAKAKKEGRDA